ncbi:MAG: hypothetical protein PHQ65_05310 [Bacteroidales bacterium]|nr:hypothetical protein [Bacteroidales bacterium]MDD3664661.1 hypothetical protein [Bacteroidales bacterium]
MYYKKDYRFSSKTPQGGDSSDVNPLKVPEGYWDSFDERVMQGIVARRKQQRTVVLYGTLAAAVIATCLFVFYTLLQPVSPEATITGPGLVTLTGSDLSDQLLADDIIEMAVSADTLLLDINSTWMIADSGSLPVETVAEYLLLSGISATEIALASNH